MWRGNRNDALEVSVASRMVVRPRDGPGHHVVRCLPVRVRFGIAAVEVVRRADSAERAERGAHVRVVTRGEDAATALPKSRDRLALGSRDPVSHIQGEEPELVVRRAIDRCEHRIVAVPPAFAVAPGHLEPHPAFPERSEMLPKQREALDRPVVRQGRCRRLDQNAYRPFHSLVPF